MVQQLATMAAPPSVVALASPTPRLGLNRPAVGADQDVWGGYWNANADILDKAQLVEPDGSIQVAGKVVGHSVVRSWSESGVVVLHAWTDGGGGHGFALYLDPAFPGIRLALTDASNLPLPGVGSVRFEPDHGSFYPAVDLSEFAIFGHSNTDSGVFFGGGNQDQLHYDGTYWGFYRSGVVKTYGNFATGNCYTVGEFVSFAAMLAAPADATPFADGLDVIRAIRPLAWTQADGSPAVAANLATAMPAAVRAVPEALRATTGSAHYVSERPLLFALVNAVRELEARLADQDRLARDAIAALTRRVATLETMAAGIVARVDDLTNTWANDPFVMRLAQVESALDTIVAGRLARVESTLDTLVAELEAL